MLIAEMAFFVDQEQSGHTPKLEEIPFLSIQVSDPVLWVGQSDERNFLVFPVALKR